jgi:hypothetical protein
VIFELAGGVDLEVQELVAVSPAMADAGWLDRY